MSKYFKIIGASITLVAAILVIPQVWMQWSDYRHAHGGSLSMSLMNHNINNNDERTIFICISSPDEELSGIGITPTFDNSSEYPIRDFDLRFNVESTEFLPNPNQLYDKIEIDNNSCQFKYQEKELPQFSQTFEPFRLNSFPKENSRYTIRAKATYAGSPYPYVYTVYVWLRIVPRRIGQSMEDWKMSCKKVIYETNASPNSFDAFYCSNKEVFHEFGKDFGTIYSTNVAKKEDSASPTVSNNNSRNVKPNPNTFSQETHETNPSHEKSDETSLSSNESFQIVSYERKIVNDTAFLYISFNQPTIKGQKYLVAFYNEKPRKEYHARSFTGNNTKEVRVRLYSEDNITYTCIPEKKDSLKQYVKYKITSDSRMDIINKSEDAIIFAVKYKDGDTFHYCLNKNDKSNFYMPNTDIESYETYLISRPLSFTERLEQIANFEDRIWLGFLLFLSLVIGPTFIGLAFACTDTEAGLFSDASIWKRKMHEVLFDNWIPLTIGILSTILFVLLLFLI